MPVRILVSLAIVSIALAGCASAPDNSVGRYKVGKPYTIKGKKYYPEENYQGEQTGVASWYGPGFHGKLTANGERFNENALTAAHPTLQMPSLVKVTNLENGMATVVRVNDRGPFHGGRIIDLSKAGAEALGFRNNGTARVRVQVLGPESMALAAAAKQGVDTRGAEIAFNQTGQLDSRFAAYFPSLVREPQPDIMVASNAYQPGVPQNQLPNQLITAEPIAVPAAPIPQAETISIAANGAPLPPRSPREPVRVMPAPVTAYKQPVFQMAPIIGEAPSVAYQAADMPVPPVATLQAPGLPEAPNPAIAPNRLPEHAAFKGVTDTGIYVQAGAPMSHENAIALKAQMAQTGPAQIIQDGASGSPYFRVRIGPLESVEKADRLVNTLQQQGRQAAIVVSSN